MNTRIYLSGGFSHNNKLTPYQSNLDWLKRTGCEYRCYSYAFVVPDAFYYSKRMADRMESDLKQGVGVMMDSSAHSFHNFAKVTRRKKNSKFNQSSIEEMRDLVVADYCKFIKKRGKDFDFYVNFDYVKHSPTIYEMQQQLQRAGIRPVPVFHGDDGFDWLKRYIDDGHKLIMIGIDAMFRHNQRQQKPYYDQVFNLLDKAKVKAHGLAVTGALMFAYPWYSVDSTSWIKCASYGQIVSFSPQSGLIRYVHISSRGTKKKGSAGSVSKSVVAQMKETVEAQGFDFDLMRESDYERGVYNAYCFSNVDKFTKKAALSRWEVLV